MLPPRAFYDRIIRELDAIGWNSVSYLAAELDAIELSVLDARGRLHALALALAPAYPLEPPVASVSLPGGAFQLAWRPNEEPSLRGAVTQFEEALASHQTAWDMLDDLDANAWVIEPKNPTRNRIDRRIALGNHCSLQLDLHPTAAASLPNLQFLGAERSLAPLRRKLDANLGRWQLSRSLRHNLQDVLEMELPSAKAASSADADAYSVACAICYAYELDGAVPDNVCDMCNKPFHGSCLSEWLQALPTTNQSFNRLFGECPYCGGAISVDAAAAAV